MAFNIAATKLETQKSLTPTSLSPKEGETVLVLIPSNLPGETRELPWVEFTTIEAPDGHPLKKAFKRSIVLPHIPANAALSNSPVFAKHCKLTEDHTRMVLDFIASLTPAQQGKIQYKQQFAWIVAPVAFKMDGMPEYIDNYKRLQVLYAKIGKKKSPHIHPLFMRAINQHGDKLFFTVENEGTGLQCFSVIRDGMGQWDTSYSNSKPTEHPNYKNFGLPEKVLKDIESDVCVGGKMDVFMLINDTFVPGIDEIAALAGVSDGPAVDMQIEASSE